MASPNLNRLFNLNEKKKRRPTMDYRFGVDDEPVNFDGFDNNSAQNARYNALWNQPTNNEGNDEVYPIKPTDSATRKVLENEQAQMRQIPDDAENAGLQSTPPPSTEGFTGDKVYRKRSERLLDNYNREKDAPAQKESSILKRFGSGLWNAFKIWGQSGAQGGIPGLLGALATGGAMQTISPAADAEVRKNNRLAKLWTEYGQAVTAENVQADQNYKQAQTENIYADNQFNRDRLKAQNEQKSATLKEQKRNNWYRQNKYFDPKNATEAQRQQLAEFGETPESIGTYDFTKPDKHVINGVTFLWDNNTRTYKEAGLPADAEKTLVDFKTKDGATYRISAKTAATLQTQLDTLGMRQDFDSRERQKDRDWRTDENEKNRKLRRDLQANAQKYGREQTITKATEAYKRAYFNAYGRQPSDQEIRDYEANIGRQIDEPLETDEQ